MTTGTPESPGEAGAVPSTTPSATPDVSAMPPTPHIAVPAAPPEIPLLVRVYGTIIMVMNIIGMAAIAIMAVVGLAQGNPFALFGGAIQFIISIIMYRLGKGLRDGEKSAVQGLCILGGLAVVVSTGLFFSGGPWGFALLGFVAVFYVPPIVMAFQHWALFK